MFGFITDLYNSITGNSGSKSATDGAKAGLVDQMNTASETRAGTNNVQGSNNTSGFLDYSSGNQNANGELDLTRIKLGNSELKEVGTTINDDNPVTKEKVSGTGNAKSFKGRPSLINPYYLVRYHSAMDASEKSNDINNLNVAEGNTDDYKGLADYAAYKNPSTSLIINHFNEGPGKNYPEKTYKYSDFLYLKHYHPFNNNRLITLRRFMAPVYDELRIAIKDVKKELRRPIAQALTYLDTSGGNKLSDFSKINVEIKTKPTTGAIDQVTTLKGAEEVIGKAGSDSSNIGIKLLSYLSQDDAQLGDTKKSEQLFKDWTSTYDPWKTGPLQDMVYGPVNVITGSLIRERGLDFKQNKLQVIFEYSSKSLENVNQKAAMLDILSNILALTYNHALFWGGENRFLIERANFPLVRAEVMFSLLNNLDDPAKAFKKIAENLGNTALTLTESFDQIFTQILEKGGDALPESKEKVAATVGQMAFGNNQKLKNLQRQILEGTKAELTGAPTGEWHLQVGNPFAPIMMIGNLWCGSTDIEFNDELSIDDFPTELKVTCTLKHGRARDASDIQSMYNGGGGRIYYPSKDAQFDVNASYSTGSSFSAVKLKDTDILGALNRTSVDRSGNKLTDAVKLVKKEDPKKIDIAKGLFQPLGQKIK